MSPVTERDFPVGHPKSIDYDPKSPEAIEWMRVHVHPKGERDFPVDHPKAIDTKGNTNATEWRAGVDPARPDFEAHTGASPEQAKARKEAELALSLAQRETPTTPEGFVDTAAIAHQTAIEFLLHCGNTEEQAEQIIAEKGLDQVLAARTLTGAKG